MLELKMKTARHLPAATAIDLASANDLHKFSTIPSKKKIKTKAIQFNG